MREIDEIKQKIDIVEFINARIPLKKTGRNFTSRCPFHTEKSASFTVSPERQIWHCFGACATGGDIFSFVMKWENIEFPEAIEELAKLAGVKLTNRFEGNDEWDKKDRLLQINHLAAEYYHYLLTTHKLGQTARDYLENRKISEKIRTTFMLGYSPSGWGNLHTFLAKKGFTSEEIEAAGLAIRGKNGWYDRFRGRLMFPLKNHRGQTVGFSGRVLDPTVKEAKYINSPETILYHKGSMVFGLDVTHENIRREGFVILCEGEFDVMSSYQAGISNIVAIKGTALSEDQLRLLKRFTSEVRLALDMDLAGDAAARRSIEMADQFDLTVRVISIPGGKDLDEAIKNDVPAVKTAVKNATAVYDFILDSAVARNNTGDPFGKKRIAQEVAPHLARINNPVIRNHYIKKLAQIIGVSEDAILETTAREQKKIRTNMPNPAPTEVKPEKISRQELIEEHLLSLIVQSPDPLKNLQFTLKNITIQDIHSNPVKRIVDVLKDKQPGEVSQVDSYLPNELLDTYNRLYLLDLGTVVTDKKLFDKELEKTVFELKKLILRKKLTRLTTNLEDEDTEEIRKITAELKSISK